MLQTTTTARPSGSRPDRDARHGVAQVRRWPRRIGRSSGWRRRAAPDQPVAAASRSAARRKGMRVGTGPAMPARPSPRPRREPPPGGTSPCSIAEGLTVVRPTPTSSRTARCGVDDGPADLEPGHLPDQHAVLDDGLSASLDDDRGQVEHPADRTSGRPAAARADAAHQQAALDAPHCRRVDRNASARRASAPGRRFGERRSRSPHPAGEPTPAPGRGRGRAARRPGPRPRPRVRAPRRRRTAPKTAGASPAWSRTRAPSLASSSAARRCGSRVTPRARPSWWWHPCAGRTGAGSAPRDHRCRRASACR